jgi:hypothetical protein
MTKPMRSALSAIGVNQMGEEAMRSQVGYPTGSL